MVSGIGAEDVELQQDHGAAPNQPTPSAPPQHPVKPAPPMPTDPAADPSACPALTPPDPGRISSPYARISANTCLAKLQTGK